MEGEIVNRVAKSPLITIDLEDFYHRGERVTYDIAENLFQGLILREKDFREFIKGHDWQQYAGKNINIICSAEAIVPTWAYMLLATKLEGVANMVVMGDKELLEYALFKQALEQINVQDYTGRPVVVKGCGDLPLSDALYVEITRLLKPVVKTIMYGEPCSTVPVYKKPREPKA